MKDAAQGVISFGNLGRSSVELGHALDRLLDEVLRVKQFCSQNEEEMATSIAAPPEIEG